MKSGLPRKGAKNGDRSRNIAESAARLFSRKGYIETSMEDISTAARLSKGGIYHYFGSKGDILEFILSDFLDAVLANAKQDLQGVEDPAERIRVVISRHVKTYSDNIHAAKVLLHEAHNLAGSKLRKIKTKEKEYFRIISGTLAPCLGEKTDRTKLTVLTFNLLGMCNWIYSWYDPKGRVGPEELAQMIFLTFTGELPGLRGMR